VSAGRAGEPVHPSLNCAIEPVNLGGSPLHIKRQPDSRPNQRCRFALVASATFAAVFALSPAYAAPLVDRTIAGPIGGAQICVAGVCAPEVQGIANIRILVDQTGTLTPPAITTGTVAGCTANLNISVNATSVGVVGASVTPTVTFDRTDRNGNVVSSQTLGGLPVALPNAAGQMVQLISVCAALPTLTVPPITAPSVTAPPITTPPITAPPVSVPPSPSLPVPSLPLPSLPLPSLPLPSVPLPSLTAPSVPGSSGTTIPLGTPPVSSPVPLGAGSSITSQGDSGVVQVPVNTGSNDVAFDKSLANLLEQLMSGGLL